MPSRVSARYRGSSGCRADLGPLTWSPRAAEPCRAARRWSPLPHWGARFADYRTIGDASVPIPRIMRVLTRCVLIVSSRIVSIKIVSVLIIGGWMMRVRRIEAPGRALAWSEMVRTPQTKFLLFAALSPCPATNFFCINFPTPQIWPWRQTPPSSPPLTAGAVHAAGNRRGERCSVSFLLAIGYHRAPCTSPSSATYPSLPES